MMESIKEETGPSFANIGERGASAFFNVRSDSDITRINPSARKGSIQAGARRTIRNSGMEAK
jgi:hypothetical protein